MVSLRYKYVRNRALAPFNSLSSAFFKSPLEKYLAPIAFSSLAMRKQISGCNVEDSQHHTANGALF